MGKDSLPSRQRAQIEAVKQFKVFHEFHFADRLNESGITFSHHAVDDVTKHMRMGHYDHGSAVAVADDWPSGRKPVLTTGIEENQTLRITESK
jgi:hypothetical protein